MKVGEYLLKVNGQDVLPTREVYSYFEATAGKQPLLQVGPTPTLKADTELNANHIIRAISKVSHS